MDDDELSTDVLSVAFPKLDDAQVAALDTVGTRRHLGSGEFLFRTGDVDLSLFVLLTGEVEIFDLAGDVRSGSVKRVAAAVGDGAMAVECVHDVLGTYV